MDRLMFLTHVGATLAMTGMIWFIQVVHYPLLQCVGPSSFAAYEAAHVRATIRVAVSVMVVELGSGWALLFWRWRPPGVSLSQVIIGLVLLGVVWLSSMMLQVPQHAALERGFDPAAHRRLVTTNWIRTVVWSARSLLVLWMVAGAMAA